MLGDINKLSKDISNNIKKEQEQQEAEGQETQGEETEQQEAEGQETEEQEGKQENINDISQVRKYLLFENKLKILSDIIKSHIEIDIKEITKLFSSKTSYEPNVQTTKKLIDQLVKRKEIKFKKSGRIKMYSTI